MWEGLGDASRAFESDSAVRTVVICGAGGKAFASGAEISEFDLQQSDAQQKQRYDEVAQRGQHALAHLSKPLVAMIQGYCIGGGLAIKAAVALLNGECLDSDDYKEGRRAFAEKRAPIFQGR